MFCIESKLSLQLDYLRNLTDELKNNNSSNAKKEILNKYYLLDKELFCKFMDYIYSFDKRYWMSSDNIVKMRKALKIDKQEFSPEQDIFDVLDQLTNRILTGHAALKYVMELIDFLGAEYEEIIFAIINKDLKANINSSLINKIAPCVKEFKVSLAERSDEAPLIHKIDFSQPKDWMVSRKLDGVRTIALLNQGEVELYSRTGQMFTTLDNLKPQIKEILAAAKKLYGEEYVLDGETCLVDENGKEDFAGIMKQITRKKHTIPNPTYILFDIIKRSEFDETIGTEKFGERIKKLVTIKPETFGSFVRIVEHETDLNENTISEWKKKVELNGWEGLMLRRMNSVYNGKRSYDLQKIKNFYDGEYEVVGVSTSTKKMLNDVGIKVDMPCVGSIVIEHKGCKVDVGSGLSDEQRIEWYHNPELIIGKVVTIQYFEETYDSKTNLPSLRFPTLKIIHGEKREV